MLEIDNTALAVIDVQGLLAAKVHGHERLLYTLQHIIKAAEIFGLPVLWSEQAPHKIGETVKPIKDLLYPMVKPILKQSFSCLGAPQYVEHLQSLNRRQILVTGIETHVCVYQTVRDLYRRGYEVHLIADAVSSRHEIDHQTAIARLREEGTIITTAQMSLCELLKTADHPRFKDIMAFLKN